MKTIAFHDNNLCLRGTTNAMYDYADYNEKILGNKSIIISSPYGNLDALDKFKNRFGEDNVLLCDFYMYQTVLNQRNTDYLYIIKGGGSSDGLCLVDTPTLIHSVFRSNEPHGHKYCYVSDWLAKDQGYDPIDYAVPHMVTRLPEPNYNLREKLGIGKDKIVFGYLGGSTEFNHNDAHEVIQRIVKERNDIYFIFMNINKFMNDHPNVIHLPGSWDLHEKSSFIDACDAMLHARSGGETFGCSVAEFSIMNKPVVTYSLSGERSHLEILGDRAIPYNNGGDLYDILSNIKSYIKYDDYYKAYENHSPEKIMERFNKNFLS
jgi:glycosyltransferase involved in cell wall biosynthesis